VIASLLIANRGEIACRIIRTARKLGVRTVAVYSDADAKALHVRQADEAVHIGPSPARESYLVGERIIAAARETGAEAIHPGYGFLSENADFAQAVLDAGLVWVGPKPDSIRAMGLKDAAKTLMAEAGVPVTPGYLGEDQSPERLKAEADAIGYPVLIKAVAGGGGKGMRRVDRAEDFADALDSCKREAASSFGNEVVLLEKYILSPRHIEVQVVGDSHGNVVPLFERVCSLQRRPQKVIDDAPAPGKDAATREAVCAAAVRAAEAVDYEGAGTIEFIADASEGLRADRIWFMEMNTRLQVEHPVTEEITGQDLVEWQLRVASGEPLPKRQEELSIRGHAIEARLYAEDPAKGFLPSVGKVEQFGAWTDPEDENAIRWEAAVSEGDSVSPFYDPMIAKVIAKGESRDIARSALMRALDESYLLPISTNKGFLFECLDHPAFVAGEITTGFIAQNDTSLIKELSPDEDFKSGIAAELWKAADWAALRNDGRAGVTQFGFRLNAKSVNEVVFFAHDLRFIGKIEPDAPAIYDGPGSVSQASDGTLIATSRGQSFQFGISYYPGASTKSADGALVAPMPGKVTSVEVAAGEQVAKGQRLLTLEAMKMEHAMVAPFDGMVAELNVEAGAQVQVEAVLARVEADARA
jgi:3-methylcrotonyl-CoA carboxylase alpha subunit